MRPPIRFIVIVLALSMQIGMTRATFAQKVSDASPQKVSDVSLDISLLAAPSLENCEKQGDVTAEPVWRLHFKSPNGVAAYFDCWAKQDQKLLPRQTLSQQALALAYGGSWHQDALSAAEAQGYRQHLNRQLFWAFLPGVTVGKTNVVGSSLVLPVNPGTSNTTLSSNLQTVYQLSWSITDHMLKRTPSKDSLDAHLAVEYKMRNDVLTTLSAFYGARKADQVQLRSCLLELVNGAVGDRIKDLQKCVEATKADLVKNNAQIDMATNGAISTAYP